MTAAMDTLGYAQRLRQAGVSQKVAEASAEAARDYIMPELATKGDIAKLKGELVVQLGGIVAGCAVLVTAVLGLIITLN